MARKKKIPPAPRKPKVPPTEMVRMPRAYVLNAIQALTTRPEFLNQRTVVALVAELSKIANPEAHRAAVAEQKRASATAKKAAKPKKV